ncbi:MAG: hypothetical protein LAN71_11960 [Acidobacteriia bacterium]|nr:hypothetical protein [Terriglobia bacterium]
MLTPDRLFRFANELIFLLLGAFLAWIGASGRVLFDRRSAAWAVLSVAMMLWGLRTLLAPEQWWQKWEKRIRGISLVLTGGLLLAIARVPFAWVAPLLIAAGILLALRGVCGAYLAARKSGKSRMPA